MAYTPSGIYNDADLSQQNKEKISALKHQWGVANAVGDEAGKTAAHAQAEAIRATQNYSGGVDGSEYVALQSSTPATSSARAATSQDDRIAQLYAAQQAQAVAGLKSAYEQNLNTLAANEAKIPGVYNSARNQTAGTYEQNKANMNERMAASGINSGTGSQAALAQSTSYAGNMSSLDRQQAQAVTDVNSQRTQLTTVYNNAIQQAIAENDLAKAQALYSEAVRVDESLVSQSLAQAQLDNQYYDRQQNELWQKAEAGAAYGDFSGYKALGYTDEQIAGMRAYWEFKTQYPGGATNFSGGSYGGTRSGSGAAPVTQQGVSFGPTATPSGASSNNQPAVFNGGYTLAGASVLAEVQAMKRQGVQNQAITNQVNAAYRGGKITSNDANKILSAIGII